MPRSYLTPTRVPGLLMRMTLLLAVLLVSPSSGRPVCNVTTFPTASDIRSGQKYIAIVTNDPIVSPHDIPSWARLIRASLKFTGPSVSIASVSLYTVEQPYEIGITLNQDSQFVVYTNNTINFTLPHEMFGGSDDVPISFDIVPSPGFISTDGLTTSFFEVQINAGNISFFLDVVDDVFQSPTPIISPSPLPYFLRIEVVKVTETRLFVNLLQNTSVNILAASGSSTITITFPPDMMKTNLSPEVGALRNGYLTLTLNPSVPSVRVLYPNGAGSSSIPSELIWDGTGAVAFELLGDVWLPNTTTWQDSVIGPLFVAVPFETDGFAKLQTCSTLNVTLTPRIATLQWSPCFGFATTQLQAVTISQWNALLLEHDGSVQFTFYIRPATPSAVRVIYSATGTLIRRGTNLTNATLATTVGPLFTLNVTAVDLLSEFDIRRYGLNITVSTYHDIISPSIDTAAVVSMFSSSGQSAATFSTTNLKFTRMNSTMLSITIPPQTLYNIQGNDDITVTAGPSILGSGSFVADSVLLIHVSAVPTPVCVYPTANIITSSMIRNNPNTTFDVFVLNDTICNVRAALTDVVPFIVTTTNAMSVSINTSYPNTTSFRFYIRNDPTYAISALDFISIPMTASLFCSLEPCVVPGSQSNEQNLVLLSVRPSPGTLVTNFAAITEIDMRVTALSLPIALAGDIFAVASFPPLFSIVTSQQDVTRGFAASIQSSCVVNVNSGNKSRAVLSCSANATYDISVTETITLTIQRTVVASQAAPDVTSSNKPLAVIPVAGIITANISNLTAINESKIISGGFVATFSLQYERWNVTSRVASALRSNYPASTTPDSKFSTTAFLSAFLSQDSFAIVPGSNQQSLAVTFPPLPDYDILTREVFPLLFDGSCVLSGLKPSNNNFTFIVSASPAYFRANGSALNFGVKDLLVERLALSIVLYNDLWNASAVIVAQELCPMTSCVVVLDSRLRVLNVLMDPNPDFYVSAATQYAISLRGSYFVSKGVPRNEEGAVMQCYLTAGLLAWTGPAFVSEGALRSGSSPAFFATIQGDLFTSVSDVRSALIAGSTCSGVNPADDPTAFCALLPQLVTLGSVSIEQRSRVAVVTMQPLPSFDVFAGQTVNLGLSSLAVQSRVAPLNTFQLTITVEAPTFTVSGLPPDLRATDLRGGNGARVVRLIIRVTGDRFASNVSSSVQAIVAQGLQVDGGGQSGIGLAQLAPSILLPSSSSLSPDQTVLTISLVPNANYLTQTDERVTLSLPGAALLSGVNASNSIQFTIAATAASITVAPLFTYASAIRSHGLIVTFSISGGGTWQQAFVQLGSQMAAAVSCPKTLVEEPDGCASHLPQLVSSLSIQGATINGSAIVVTLNRVPEFNVVDSDGIVFSLSRNWTTSSQTVFPSTLRVTILSDPLTVYAVVAMKAVVPADTPWLVDEPSFVTTVSRLLLVPEVAIQIVSNEPSPQLRNTSAGYFIATIGFQILDLDFMSSAHTVSGVDAVFVDNEASLAFLGLAPPTPLVNPTALGSAVSWRHLAYRGNRSVVNNVVVLGYSSAAAPPASAWQYISTGVLPVESTFVFPLSPLAVFAIVVAAALLVTTGLGLRRAAIQRVSQGGLMRAAERTTDYVPENTIDDGADDQAELDDAIKFHAGQETTVFSLATSGEHTAPSGSPSAAASGGGGSGGRRVLDPSRLEHEVPILLYSGQKSPSGVSPFMNQEEQHREGEVVLDVRAFLVEGGYLPKPKRDNGELPRGRRVTKDEARLQAASVAAGLIAKAAKEGDLVERDDDGSDIDNPFPRAVYPPWSKARTGAFVPPSKFRDNWDLL